MADYSGMVWAKLTFHCDGKSAKMTITQCWSYVVFQIDDRLFIYHQCLCLQVLWFPSRVSDDMNAIKVEWGPYWRNIGRVYLFIYLFIELVESQASSINEGFSEGVFVPSFSSKIALRFHVPTHFRYLFPFVIFRILFPCSQKMANVPLFPSIFCQCSLVPQNPWETLFSLKASIA